MIKVALIMLPVGIIRAACVFDVFVFDPLFLQLDLLRFSTCPFLKVVLVHTKC